MKNYQAIAQPQVVKKAEIHPYSLNSPKLPQSPCATDHKKSLDHQNEMAAAAASAAKKNPKISSKR